MAPELEVRVRNALAESGAFREEISTLNTSDSFTEMGVLDSIGVLMLITQLEEVFEIQVTDEEVLPENFDSISLLTEYIRSKINMQKIGDSVAN